MTTLNHNQTTVTSEIKLSSEQQAVFDEMEKSHQHLFITGRAGTGKSVLLRHFRENTNKKVVVVAPTGIAALNVRGQTIHSLFRLAIGLQRKGGLQPNSRACMLLRRVETIIIDEISMVRADLMDAIDERMREAHHNALPFGGVQVIMFGDVYQLPPVVEDSLFPYFEKIYGGYHFFKASVWNKTEFKIYELSQIFRQKDPAFKNILNAVRDGSFVDAHIDELNERCGVPIPDGTLTLAATNSLVTNINQRRLNQLEGETFEYKATITGEMKKGTFPTEETLSLKVGAQVVLLQNDKDKRWVNGSIATIAKLKKEEKDKKGKIVTPEVIAVLVDGIEYDLDQVSWEEIRYEYDPSEGKVKEEVVSSFTQYPIRLAWAMTIHKSQGQTYDSVALDLTTSTFAPGQMYVALSRCTSMEGLYLKMPVKRKDIIVDSKVKEFMSRVETIVIEQPETCIQNNDEIIESPQIEVQDTLLCIQNNEQQRDEVEKEHETCIQNNEGTTRKRKPGGGRKRKEDLKRICVKLSDEQIEKTSDIDRSELIRSLLDTNFDESGDLVSIRLPTRLMELTECVDRSALIAELLNKHFGI